MALITNTQLLFFDSEFDTILYNNVITGQYPQMNKVDKDILFKYLKKVVITIALIYNFERDISVYKHQLFQNNYQDLKWLCTLLIDYNDNPSNIKSFNDLYTSKIDDSAQNIEKSLPKYKFSNVQFGRCFRGEKVTEITFNEEYIRDNTNLLISAIIDSSHKFYVNWIDILPFSFVNIDNLKKYSIYNHTEYHFINKNFKELNFINDIDYTPENLLNYNSLTVNEIYNVIRNFLYEDIKSIKLLIYDMKSDNNTIACIQFLHSYFGDILVDALNNKNWDELDEEMIDIFTNNLKPIINSIITKRELFILSIQKNIMADSLERLLKSFVISFDNQFSSRKLVKDSGYISLKKEYIDVKQEYEDEKNIDEEVVYTQLTLEDMITTFNSIKPEFVYEFLKNMLQKFKYTYYSYIILTPDKTNIYSEYNYDITLKNIYNFAKSFSRYKNGDDYPAYPKNWHSLNKKEKQEILDRLNENSNKNYDKEPTKWFNIAGYIKYIYPGISSTDNKRINKEIYEKIRDDLNQIIFLILHTKGLLIDFIPNKRLTDQQYTKRERELIKAEILKNDPNYFNKNNKYNASYCYLTELPYKISGDILINDNRDVGNNSVWFTAYALDWISQISFCHKFINQRISFVTGGTGIGKSTQVPKLYMYYLKALDYKQNGKVACTQPRKTPTENNAKRVSDELGFSIYQKREETDKTFGDDNKEEDTDNYYIQMHYKERKHIKSVPHLSLKYITDGTLVEEIKTLHPLFKQINLNNKVVNDNLYDVVIVDEAHEHNKNMDLILTLMRDYCYFNPEIRLIILSATMDDDEPTYRRYYRDINDNLKYPINTNLREYKIDRVNVDRRLHISPPGFGTLFEIKEHYSKINIDDSKQFAINTVTNIIKGGLSAGKDILVFLPGKGEITELVEELNEITPPNVIAVPFYSELPNDKKTLIENIDRKYTEITLQKYEDFKDADMSKSSASYTNFIICATNMAEASITIKRLYYVVETGTRKTNIYNYTRRGNKLELLGISESSRKQRKGRVGRTGPGEVYYSYKLGTMENNKILFDFSTNNMSNDIFNLLISVEPSDDRLINFINLFKDKELLNQFGYMFDLTDKIYIGNPKHYDYDYINRYTPKKYFYKKDNNYESGYTSETLYDAIGEFYIIHPEELDFDRNILGNIVNVKQTRKDITLNKNIKMMNNIPIINNIIKSLKIDSFFDDLYLKKYINKSFITTDFGKLIRTLIVTFGEYFNTEDENLPTLLIQGMFLNIEETMVKIVSMMTYFTGKEEKASNFMASEFLQRTDIMIEKNLYKPGFGKFFKTSKGYSEAVVLEEFANILLKFLTNIFDNFNEIDKEIAKARRIKVEKINEIINEFKEEEDTQYDRKTILLDRIRLLSNKLKDNKLLLEIAGIMKIKPSIIVSFIKSYVKMNDFIIKIKNPDKRNKNLKNDILKIQAEYNVTIPKEYDKLTLAFLLSQPFNIVKKIQNKNRYLLVYNPTSDNIFSIPKVKQIISKKPYYDTYLLIDKLYVQNYVLFYNIDMTKDTIHLLMNIDKSYFKLFPMLYNFNRINEISSKPIIMINKYIKKIEVNKKLEPSSKFSANMTLSEDISVLSSIKDTYNNILQDIQ